MIYSRQQSFGKIPKLFSDVFRNGDIVGRSILGPSETNVAVDGSVRVVLREDSQTSDLGSERIDRVADLFDVDLLSVGGSGVGFAGDRGQVAGESCELVFRCGHHVGVPLVVAAEVAPQVLEDGGLAVAEGEEDAVVGADEVSMEAAAVTIATATVTFSLIMLMTF